MSTRCIQCQAALSAAFRWSDLLTFRVFQADPLLPVEQWLCSSCQNQIEWLEEDLCSLCSRSLDKLDSTYIKQTYTNENLPQNICYDCYRWKLWEQEQGMERILERNISAVAYQSVTQDWIEQFKFRKDSRMKYFLASLLVEKAMQCVQTDSFDLLVPIPLSSSRLFERGFNQSEELALCLAPKLKIEVASDILIKRDDLFKQSKRGRDSRLTEMLKKFLKNSQSQVDIYKKRILLVDDIYTTGATLYAAAYILRQEGVASVSSLTLAR